MPAAPHSASPVPSLARVSQGGPEVPFRSNSGVCCASRDRGVCPSGCWWREENGSDGGQRCSRPNSTRCQEERSGRANGTGLGFISLIWGWRERFGGPEVCTLVYEVVFLGRRSGWQGVSLAVQESLVPTLSTLSLPGPSSAIPGVFAF